MLLCLTTLHCESKSTRIPTTDTDGGGAGAPSSSATSSNGGTGATSSAANSTDGGEAGAADDATISAASSAGGSLGSNDTSAAGGTGATSTAGDTNSNGTNTNGGANSTDSVTSTGAATTSSVSTSAATSDGSGGMGGVAGATQSATTLTGSGGTGDVDLPLGEACSGHDQCISGFCADEVCCDAACDDVCMQCGSDGLCNDIPADDPGCGVIDCPADSDCRDYQADLTTARCAAFGACRAPESCDYTDEPARTKCGAADTSEICDGEGSCEFAEVYCGASSCSVGPGSCCQAPNDPLVCLGPTDSCPLGATKSQVYECNDETDCALGLVCCRQSPGSPGPGLIETVCLPPVQCVSQSGVGRVQLCSTTEECTTGECVPQEGVIYPHGICTD